MKSREEKLADSRKYYEDRRRLDVWLKGWECGACFAPIPPELRDDNDFTDGWTMGRAAKARAKEYGQKKYKTIIGVVRLM